FIDPKFLNKFYKVVKALYGLHQALRAWYATLSTFLVQSRYRRGLIDKNLFIKKDKKDILLVTPKTLHLQAVKRIFKYLKGQPKLGLWYPRESAFDLKAYSDNDYAGANLDRKSTTRAYTFCCQQKVNAALHTLTTARVYTGEGTGFSRDVTPLFDNMLVQAPEEVGILQADAQSIHITTEPSTSKSQKKHKPKRKHAQESEVPPIESTTEQNLPLPSNDPLPSAKEKSSKQERKITNIDADVEINLEKAQAHAYYLDLDHQEKVLSMMDVNEEEPASVEEVLEVVKVAKLMTEVVTTAGATKVSVPRKRRGVIIQDPEETTTTATMQPKVQAKDKGKAILIEEPKPLKRQAQIKLDKEVVRQLEAEINADIN
nr:uncharacterized mitochondrial protein AtMg00810-like [Tanacetum cinerariifolium]